MSICATSSVVNQQKIEPELYGNPRQRVQKESFHGREKELKYISETLNQEKRSNGITILIHGAGGIGKTELALEAADRNRHAFKSIIWMNAETKNTLKCDLISVCKQISERKKVSEIKDQDISVVVNDFYELLQKEKTLIVFDNATCDKSDDFLHTFLPPSLLEQSKLYIIVTSQFSEWKSQEKIQINEFDEVDAIAFIKKKLLLKRITEDTKMIVKLVKWTGCLTLSLELTAAYIIHKREAQKHYSIQQYLDNAKLIPIKGRNTKNVRHENARNVSQVLNTCIKSVSNEENYGKLAFEILYLMAFMEPDGIPLSFFSIIEKNEENVQEVCLLLADYSLIKYDKKSQICSIHRLPQRVLRENYDIKTVLRALDNDIENRDFIPKFSTLKGKNLNLRIFAEGISC